MRYLSKQQWHSPASWQKMVVLWYEVLVVVWKRSQGKGRRKREIISSHPSHYSLARGCNIWGMIPRGLTFQAEPCAARTAPTFIWYNTLIFTNIWDITVSHIKCKYWFFGGDSIFLAAEHLLIVLQPLHLKWRSTSHLTLKCGLQTLHYLGGSQLPNKCWRLYKEEWGKSR